MFFLPNFFFVLHLSYLSIFVRQWRGGSPRLMLVLFEGGKQVGDVVDWGDFSLYGVWRSVAWRGLWGEL